MLSLEDVTIKRGMKIIFYNWSAKIENSKVTIISGKNGVGKSTLLRVIAGLIPIEKGIMKNHNNEIADSLLLQTYLVALFFVYEQEKLFY